MALIVPSAAHTTAEEHGQKPRRWRWVASAQAFFVPAT